MKLALIAAGAAALLPQVVVPKARAVRDGAPTVPEVPARRSEPSESKRQQRLFLEAELGVAYALTARGST